MKLFKFLVCSTIKILHDLSSDRREPDRFLSIMKVEKMFLYERTLHLK